jgi:predicted MFS family arabinose efflux permease
MLGPVMGQLIFNLVGFERTFYCTAGILAIPFVAQYIFVPSSLNFRGGEEGGS